MPQEMELLINGCSIGIIVDNTNANRTKHVMHCNELGRMFGVECKASFELI